MSTWRVMLSVKLWNQAKYEEQWRALPECKRIAQSKGRAKMVILPEKGDTVKFILQGRVVMKGTIESDGFISGTAHREHSCNTGDSRPHSEVDEFAWVQISEIGLSEPVSKSGQRTWLKLKQ